MTLTWMAVLVLAQGPASPPGSQRPAFRADTDIVQVDVSVLDGKRRLVRGLTAEDFTVLEDGKVRPIATFAPVELPGPPRRDADAAAWTREVPRDLVTNDIPRDGRLVVIVFDRTIRFEDQAASRRIALAAVDSLDEGDMASLVFTSQFSSGGNAVDFTTDRARLRAAIAQPFAVMPHELPIDALPPPVGGDMGQAAALQRNFNFNGVMLMDPNGYESGDCLCGICVSEAIARIARAIRDLPGRTKTLLFIGTYYPGIQSSYMPFADMRAVSPTAATRRGATIGPPPTATRRPNPCETAATVARDEMVKVTGLANLTVHALDPAGIETTGNSPLGGGTDAVTGIARTLTRQDSLKTLADLTGGRVVMNTNAPEKLVPGVLEESGSYYLLGFERTSRTPDGNVHRIEVKVKGRGLSVHARSGYLAPSAEKTTSSFSDETTPAGRAILGVLPETQLRLGVSVASFAGDEDHSLTTIAVNVQRRAAASDTIAAPGTRRTDVVVGVFDRRGNPVASANQVVNLVGPASTAMIRYETISHLALKPGHYDLRVGATDTLTQATGSVHTTIDVPDLSGNGLHVSDLVLSQPTEATSPLDDDLVLVLPLVPTSTRTFSQTDTPSAFVRVYQGGRSDLGAVAIELRILDVTNRTAVESRATLDAARFGTSRSADYQLELPVGQLSPGEYLLTFSATLGGDTSGRSLRFRVQ